jgi:hypothetical protein
MLKYWLAALLVGVSPAYAADKACTDNSRGCMVAAASSLLEGMWAGKGADARLAPNVRKTENGGKSVTEGAAAIRKQLDGEHLAGHKSVRFFVDEAKRDVFAFWMTGTGGDKPAAGHVAERIRVDKGLITEIEVFWVSDSRPFADVPVMWPDVAPAGSDACDKNRACLIAAANTYLDGLVAADGSKVKFTPNIRRTQQGKLNQEGEAVLRASVAKERLAFRRNFRVFADTHTGNVIAVWLTGTDTATMKSTAHVIERLRIQNGLISEIEVFYPLEQGVLDGTSGWPDEP